MFDDVRGEHEVVGPGTYLREICGLRHVLPAGRAPAREVERRALPDRSCPRGFRGEIAVVERGDDRKEGQQAMAPEHATGAADFEARLAFQELPAQLQAASTERRYDAPGSVKKTANPLGLQCDRDLLKHDASRMTAMVCVELGHGRYGGSPKRHTGQGTRAVPKRNTRLLARRHPVR